MKPESNTDAAAAALHGLYALLARLDALASGPRFRAQRDQAMRRALQPYTEYGPRIGLSPLPGEVEQANLYVLADYFPEDGQLTLIEQIRDTIDVHVPEDEREWLDPLKHSFLDLFDLVSVEERNGSEWWSLQSLGDGRTAVVERPDDHPAGKAGQRFLARLIHAPDRHVLGGTPLVLARDHATRVLQSTREWQREREAEWGAFELGRWDEFVKRYGYVLLWMFAQARVEALITSESTTVYVTEGGHPLLYAIALYDHDHQAFQTLAAGMDEIPLLRPAAPGRDSRAWEADDSGRLAARITLTPSQLILECESAERLDHFKHQLAAAFGFALHFNGETTRCPTHELPTVSLERDDAPSRRVVVTTQAALELLKDFLQTTYLEWPDRPSPSLGGMTPRHAGAAPGTRAQVASLIDGMERHDLGRQRWGLPAYDYDLMREHIGLSRRE